MVFLLDLLAIGALALVIWFIGSQMILPALRNTPSFPIFRRSGQRKEEVSEKLRELQAKGELLNLEQQAQSLEAELQKEAGRHKKDT
jgi:hypothetical protein